ncbi:enoyl-CoA hydratase family protein [Prescottella sp. R16]|uniref:enoyl-CoA hydratase family protein n=1 Tax=Prescottella sp. R16 TaxID=3064529 RepID=UPI00272EDBBF|nr:enoyl-CoA hydratase family protein [Prescottella sp. R16]
MTDRLVRYEVADALATVVLDSPHNRNAISTRLVDELRQCLSDAAADAAVRAVVLTHTGGTFCAGADLTEASAAADATPQELAAQRTARTTELLRSIVELPKPVIGCLDGHVRAGGMGLVGACDIVVAGPDTTFALTEARLGLAASIISLTVIPRLTSRAAGRYFLTGEKFGPHEAEAIGLISEAVPDTKKAIDDLAATLRACSPQGLAESKKLTTMRMLADFDRWADDLAAQSARLFGSPEAVEGMTAFLQKRPPSWETGA